MLRAILAIAAALQGFIDLTGAGGWTAFRGGLLCAAALALALGLLTPLAGGMLAAITGPMALWWTPPDAHAPIEGRLTATLCTAIALSLVLLGPGAFSVDARLFGRREIIIPPASGRPPR